MPRGERFSSPARLQIRVRLTRMNPIPGDGKQVTSIIMKNSPRETPTKTNTCLRAQQLLLWPCAAVSLCGSRAAYGANASTRQCYSRGRRSVQRPTARHKCFNSPCVVTRCYRLRAELVSKRSLIHNWNGTIPECLSLSRAHSAC